MAESAEVTVCNTVDAGSIPARTSKIGCSSMVERRTVNAKVAGSSPAIRAIRAWHSGCVLDSISSYVGSIPAALANHGVLARVRLTDSKVFKDIRIYLTEDREFVAGVWPPEFERILNGESASMLAQDARLGKL